MLTFLLEVHEDGAVMPEPSDTSPEQTFASLVQTSSQTVLG